MAFTLILLIANIDCTPRQKVAPELEAIPLQHSTLLDSVISAGDKINTIKGRCKVTIHSPDAEDNFKLDFLYKKPLNLKCYIRGFLGSSVASLLSNGDSLLVYVPDKNEIYIDKFTENGYNTVLNLHFNFLDVVEAVFGSIDAEVLKKTPVEFEAEIDKYKVVFDKEGEKETYYINPGIWTISSHQVYREDLSSLLDISFEDYVLIDGAWRPETVKMVNPIRSEWVEIRFEKQKINKNIEKSIFEIDIPEGVEYIKLY